MAPSEDSFVPLLRKPCSVLLLCALTLGLGACGRKGPLDAPPQAAAPPGTPGTPGGPPAPVAPVAATSEGQGVVSGQGTPEPEGGGGNFAWSPVGNRSAGVNGATTREVRDAPAARERSVLDWLVN